MTENSLSPEFYQQHVEQVMLPFWIRAMDHENGGVYTCFNNSGDRLVSKDKYTWSQGRFLWLLSKIYKMISQGRLHGDQSAYLDHAAKTAQFLENHVFMENGNCAFLLTEKGEKKESLPGKGYDTSIYADFFVIIGLAGYAEITNDIHTFERVLKLYDHTAERIKSGVFRSDPYPVPEGYRAHAIPMIMMHVAQETSDVAEMLNHGRHKELQQHATGFKKQILEEFTQKDHRVVEMLPVDKTVKDTLLYRHFNPGHTIECMWFVMHVAQSEGRLDHINKAMEVIGKAVDLGWDETYGGLYRFTDAEGGRPDGVVSGTEYEKLVLDTWDMKLWWPHSEALYAALLAYQLSGKKKMMDIYKKFFDYTFRVFPHPDPAVGEWIQIRDRKGDPVDKVAALPVKDPFHVLRNLLLIIDLLGENK